MRTTQHISLFLGGLLWVVLLGTSCKKNNNVSFGVPTISMVSQPLDSVGINTGSFAQWVTIYGTNLGSAQSVSFNDQTVAYKDIYASDTSVTVQIPRSIPQKVTNTVTVTTKGGTVTYNFTTLIPDLQVTDMFNEYTPVGDTLIVTGQNFDLYGLDTSATTVTFTGGQMVSVASGTPTGLKVVVPAGAQPGPITVKGPASTNVNVTTTAWYMDNRNFLVSMTNFTGWNGSAYLSSGPNPAPINGPYFEVNKTFQAGYQWDPWCSNYCNIPAALVNDPTQYVHYALKFEMNAVALPAPLYMCFNNGTFENYLYDPSGTNTFPFTTNGQWETFTVPLSSWGNLNGFTYVSSMIMEFMVQSGIAVPANFAICNYRLVPIN
jgi:hypothetical protein